jgi:hypothetical protein
MTPDEREGMMIEKQVAKKIQDAMEWTTPTGSTEASPVVSPACSPRATHCPAGHVLEPKPKKRRGKVVARLAPGDETVIPKAKKKPPRRVVVYTDSDSDEVEVIKKKRPRGERAIKPPTTQKELRLLEIELRARELEEEHKRRLPRTKGGAVDRRALVARTDAQKQATVRMLEANKVRRDQARKTTVADAVKETIMEIAGTPAAPAAPAVGPTAAPPKLVRRPTARDLLMGRR